MTLSCSNLTCLAPLDNLRGVDPNTKPHDGSLLICSTCGLPSIVICYDEELDGSEARKFATRPVTNEDFALLDNVTSADLRFALKILIARHRKLNKKLILPP